MQQKMVYVNSEAFTPLSSSNVSLYRIDLRKKKQLVTYQFAIKNNLVLLSVLSYAYCYLSVICVTELLNANIPNTRQRANAVCHFVV